MRTAYRRWMEEWETRLCFRANNRVVRPFEWGIEWSRVWPGSQEEDRNGREPAALLLELNQ